MNYVTVTAVPSHTSTAYTDMGCCLLAMVSN